MRNGLRIGIAVAVLFNDFTEVIAPLSAGIRNAPLYAPERSSSGMESGGLNIVEEGGVCDGGCAALKVSVLSLLVGGIPLAFAAFALGRKRRGGSWHRKWGRLFQAGFALSLISLMLSGLLLALMIGMQVSVVSEQSVQLWPVDVATLLLGAFLLADCCCSAIALRWWLRVTY
jgi:hypothetical protein